MYYTHNFLQFSGRGSIIDTDYNFAYDLSINLSKVSDVSLPFSCVILHTYHCVQLPSTHEVQYEQIADVLTADDTGFTMSTNAAYSTVTTH